MKLKILSLILLLLVAWFGQAIARLENENSALLSGQCGPGGLLHEYSDFMERERCLEEVGLRRPVFALLSGLGIL